MTHEIHRFLLVALVVLVTRPALAQPETRECGGDTKAAIAQARQALADGGADLHEPVACLLARLEAADKRINDLTAGRISFEGPVKAPGFLHIPEKDGAQ